MGPLGGVAAAIATLVVGAAIFGACVERPATESPGSGVHVTKAYEPDMATVELWSPGDPDFARPAQRVPINGAVYHGMWDEMSPEIRSANLDRLAANGVNWVRMDVAWSHLQPVDAPIDPDSPGVLELDRRIREIRERGIRILIMFWWAPQWSSGTADKSGVPGDPQDYADAIAWAARHWAGDVAAWEVWNEPDLLDFWAAGEGRAGVAAYVDMARRAYDAVKDPAVGNPDATVVVGSPTHVNTDWFELFYEAEPRHKFDALGVHPYMSDSSLPPDFSQPDARYQKYTMLHIGRLVELMREHGDVDKEIWATEYGWANFANTGTEPPWSRGVSLEQQADYALRAQGVLSYFPQVRAAFWYNSRDKWTGEPIEDNRGLTRRDNTDKPVLKAVKCIITGVCGPPEPGLSP